MSLFRTLPFGLSRGGSPGRPNTAGPHPEGDPATDPARKTDGWHDGYLNGGAAGDHSVAGDAHAHEHGHHGRDGMSHHSDPLARLVQFVKLERDDIWAAIVFAVTVGIMSLAMPVAVQSLVNTVAFGGLVQPIVVLSLLVFVGLSFAATLRALQARVVERIQQRIFARVAFDLAARLPRVDLRAFDREHGPELVNRFMDVVTVQKSASTLLVDGVQVFLATVVGMIVLGFYHPYLLIFDLVLIVSVAATVLGFVKKGSKTSIYESKAKYATLEWLEEMARHLPLFKTPGGIHRAEIETDNRVRHYITARQAHFKVVFTQIALALGLQVIASTALLGIGGALVIERQLTLGQLVAAELIVTTVVAGFTKFSKYLESYYDAIAGMDKLGHLFDLPLETAPHEPVARATDSRGIALKFEGVGYEYGHGRAAVEGVHLSIDAGERVVIHGPAASGKSTLADLLYALRVPSHGRLLVDDVDSRHVIPRDLRNDVVLVRGEEVFAGTVADNLRAARSDVTPRQAREALEAVGLWPTIVGLPDGLGTKLATRGAPLSATQATALTFARALLATPRLLIIDGALDDIDEQSRAKFCEALRSRASAGTVIVFSRRADVLGATARKVALSKNGHIVEHGGAPSFATEGA
jgi:ABC-type bacteriocin/lantibiotic exporter with double-glycine peptidase domain